MSTKTNQLLPLFSRRQSSLNSEIERPWVFFPEKPGANSGVTRCVKPNHTHRETLKPQRVEI